MLSFSEYNNQELTEQEILLGLFYLMESSDDVLTEEYISEGIEDLLKKFGLHVSKGDGLIRYIAKFTKGAGKLLLAALKGDKAKVKELATSISKEELIDFLLKLDTLTLHMFTGPIHIIDAVTGWHIGPNIEHIAKKGADLLGKLKKTYQELKDIAKKVFVHSPNRVKAIEKLEPIIMV